MPPIRMRMPGKKAKNPGKTMLRLMSYMKRYVPIMILVLICIFINTYAQTTGSAALGTLVDDFIIPMAKTRTVDKAALADFLVDLGSLLALGIVCSFLHSYLMVGVTQGTQKVVRDEMFSKMQRLPLRYFDSNTAGNIMSRYTSDIDTLRQMISQFIPQAATSLITLTVVLWKMFSTSVFLTFVTLGTVLGITAVTMLLVSKAGKFFVGQQKSLGSLNG